MSRHHHITVLAAAWWLTQDERYAEAAADQLRSWWRANPFLSGVHWTSGIEAGVRLISWAWTRRLLARLAEGGRPVRAQRGRRAADRLASGVPGRLPEPRLVGQQPRRRRGGRTARRGLRVSLVRPERSLAARAPRRCSSGSSRTTPSTMASTASWRPTTTASCSSSRWWPPSRPTRPARHCPRRPGPAWHGCSMPPPRSSTSPAARRGRGTATKAAHSWSTTRSATRGPWSCPPAPRCWARRTGGRPSPGGVQAPCSRPWAGPAGLRRAPSRPRRFAEAGLVLLRSRTEDGPEIWCRCDGGPHGFLSIAAHAHADALSLEVRHDGVDLLADPGTCRGSSRSRGRPAARPRRAAPPPTARRRARARRSTGSRAGRRRPGTRAPDRPRAASAGSPARRPRTGPVARPVAAGCRGRASAPSAAACTLPASCGHQPGVPSAAPAVPSATAHGSRSGSSSTSARPSSPSP